MQYNWTLMAIQFAVKMERTHFSPAEWIEQQKELKPHWFPSSTQAAAEAAVRVMAGPVQVKPSSAATSTLTFC
jgi:hypothetical protein